MGLQRQTPDLEQLNASQKNNVGDLLGIRFEALDDEPLTASIPVDSRAHQPFGLLHGGAPVVLAESLGSMASHLCVDTSQYYYVGLEVNANHLRGLRNGRVTAVARAIHLGHTTHVQDIHLSGDDDKSSCATRLTMAVVPLAGRAGRARSAILSKIVPSRRRQSSGMEQITHSSSGIPGVRLIDAEHNRSSFPRHLHLEYHIGLLLQGWHRYAAGDERRLTGIGDALLVAPESIHDGSNAGEESYRTRVLALDADWPERASRDLSDGRRGAPRLTSSLVRDERLQQRLRQLYLDMLGGAAALENRLVLGKHLWQALACLLSLGSSLRLEEGDRQGFGQRDWTWLRDWLESCLEYPPNPEELAAFCGLSPWQVLRRFRRHCGLPPHQQPTQLRLERVLPLVLRGEQPLSQVAQQFGFYDQAHLSRLFRHTYRLSPVRLHQR